MQITKMDDYARMARDFRLELPDRFNFGRDVVDAQAERNDKPALIWSNDAGAERRFLFSDIKRGSNQLANLLTRQGLRKGDRILIVLPRLPEWQISMVACLKIGAIPIPCIEMLTPKDILYRVSDSGAVGAITTAPNCGKFDGMVRVSVRVAIGDAPAGWTAFDEAVGESELFQCAEMGIEDPALLYYTSGSSGNPKGVLHAARSLYAWRLSAAWWQTLEEDDVKWCTSDTGWAKAGTGILFGPWSRGSCVVFHDGKFDVNQRLRLLAKHRVTVFCAPATEFRHLVTAPVAEHDLSALRLSVSAGESVNPEIVRRWHELTGAQLLDGYGQTETLMTVLNYPCMPVKPGSMGKPIPGTRFDILGEEGRVLGDGEEGQLAMRLPNPQFMLGYWNNPERTQESLRRVDGVEYWLTGDLALRDADGYLFYTGRTDDIISSAGYRIGPTEVENALIEHPSVVESAVVAKPDQERGEIVKAFVVLREGVVASDQLVAELQKHVQRVTAPYKYPRQIAFVETLPKNASGKLLRRVLRDQEYAAQAAHGAQPLA
jgi:acyl-coenzyme A synthetase/AMP-(fatty) acid ligase